jgi:hypothetical protein
MLCHRFRGFFLQNKQCELEAIIDSKGMPTMWFTLLAADSHWVDLHKLMYGGMSLDIQTNCATITENIEREDCRKDSC